MYLLIIGVIIIVICILFRDKQENFSTKNMKNCCLSHFYGVNSENCNKCPSDRPFSKGPVGLNIQTTDGKCPNETIDACIPCPNLCEPYNPKKERCAPLCPSSCRVIRKNNKFEAQCYGVYG